MKIAFHGAAQTVTGSKHLLSLDNGKKILLDCGMFQGLGKETGPLNEHFGFDPKEINYLILSHAHIDHSGLIPRLVQQGFSGKIYCTPATKELAMILLEDSAIIQKDDTRYLNKRRERQGLPLVNPLYTVDDVKSCIDLFETINYNSLTEIDKDIAVLFTDAGHIIGSASVHLTIQENGKKKQLTFSGDIGRYRDVILRSPAEFPQADYLIIESTYGNSRHEDVFSSPDDLHEWIHKTCVEKKGKLIIPAFSVGRTQEILYFLNQLSLERRLPVNKVYVDSPLSAEATAILKKYPAYFNNRIKKVLLHDDDPFDFPGLHYIKNAEESKALNFDNTPCVIISASGMADAGRVKHHIKNNIEKPEATILIVGYCEPNSLGGKITRKEKKIRIFGEEFQLKAEVGVMRSMSAHGDYEDICQYLSCQEEALIEKLFIVHGEPDVQYEFANRLEKKGFKEVYIPKLHSEYKLS